VSVPPILVYTCDAYAWSVKPFLYLLDVYWSQQQPVVIGGCQPFPTPENVTWLNVESRIKERWSDGLIECLHQIDSDTFVWCLEDYWLCRTVDVASISSLAEYMGNHTNVLKIDLTGDRLHSGAAIDVDYWGHNDLIETSWDTPYQWSIQAALWNRELLLRYLRPEMSPWNFELQDSKPRELRVLGTRQFPVRYVNSIGMGLDAKYLYRTEHVRDGLGGRTIERIPYEHIDEMLRLEILPPQEK